MWLLFLSLSSYQKYSSLVNRSISQSAKSQSILRFLSCSSVNGTISQLSGLYPTYTLIFSLCDTTTMFLYFFSFSSRISFCFFKLGSTFFISSSFVGSAYRNLKYSFRNYKVISIPASTLFQCLTYSTFFISLSRISSSWMVCRYQKSGSVISEKSNLVNLVLLSINLLPMSLDEESTSLKAGSTMTGALDLWFSKISSHVIRALLKGLTMIRSTSTSFIFSLHSIACWIPLSVISTSRQSLLNLCEMYSSSLAQLTPNLVCRSLSMMLYLDSACRMKQIILWVDWVENS